MHWTVLFLTYKHFTDDHELQNLAEGGCGCVQAWPEGLAGIELKVNGFSHKLPLLLEQLVKALVTLKVRVAVIIL